MTSNEDEPVKSTTTLNSADLKRLAPALEWSRTLTPGLLAAFVVIIVVLIATLVADLTNLRNVYDAAETVAHTYTVKGAVNRLLATMIGAETARCGFVITVRC